jgi:hypothetical protein
MHQYLDSDYGIQKLLPSPPGELIFIGVGMLSVGMLFLSTNTLDMNECDALVSNRTSDICGLAQVSLDRKIYGTKSTHAT